MKVTREYNRSGGCVIYRHTADDKTLSRQKYIAFPFENA